MSEIGDELKFKRYLYFLTEDQHCVVRKPSDYEFKNLVIDSLINLVAEKKYKTIIDIIEAASNDDSLPERHVLFFLLMHCCRHYDDKDLRTLAYTTVSKIIKNSKEFFLFLKYDKEFHKNVSTGVKRIIRNYYLKTDPMELYNIITQQNSYFGWSHQDVLKLGHLKSDDNLLQSVLLAYAVRDIDTAKQKIADNKDVPPEVEKIIKNLEELQTFKHCQDEKQAASMIKEHQFTVRQLPSRFLKSQVVWEALIPPMEIPDVIKELNRFHKLGFFKGNNNPVVTKVVDVITDTEKCKKCKIHPADVLIEMKTFERGKPIDPNLKQYLQLHRANVTTLTKKVDSETQTTTIVNSKEKQEVSSHKNNAIINAFSKLLNNSFRNPVPTGRRIMVTIELRQPQIMKPTFGTKTVTCLEAATILVSSLMKTEKDVTVASFNGDNVNIIQLAKGMTFNQIHQKLKETSTEYVLLPKPFSWATEKNKHIDLFINILYTGDAVGRIPKEIKRTLKKEDTNVLAAFKKYKNKMKLVNTKLINISLAGRSLMISDGSKGILDITGFNATVPRMIEAYCKGSVL